MDDIPQGPAAPCSQLDGEPSDAYRLFQAYTALPPHLRKLDRLASATGYAYGTLANYSSAYRWRERAAECDGVDELRAFVERRRVRELLLDRAAQLDAEASTGELVKVGRALAQLDRGRPVRHPQPRGGNGQFLADAARPGRRPTLVDQVEPDPECECRNPDCRAPLAGCTGGYCSRCSSTAAAAS